MLFNKNLLQDILRKNRDIGTHELLEISNNWRFIVGKITSKHAIAIKLQQKNKYDPATLFLEVKPKFMMEINLLQEKIKNKINCYFCRNFIREIISIPQVE